MRTLLSKTKDIVESSSANLSGLDGTLSETDKALRDMIEKRAKLKEKTDKAKGRKSAAKALLKSAEAAAPFADKDEDSDLGSAFDSVSESESEAGPAAKRPKFVRPRTLTSVMEAESDGSPKMTPNTGTRRAKAPATERQTDLDAMATQFAAADEALKRKEAADAAENAARRADAQQQREHEAAQAKAQRSRTSQGRAGAASC